MIVEVGIFSNVSFEQIRKAVKRVSEKFYYLTTIDFPASEDGSLHCIGFGGPDKEFEFGSKPKMVFDILVSVNHQTSLNEEAFFEEAEIVLVPLYDKEPGVLARSLHFEMTYEPVE